MATRCERCGHVLTEAEQRFGATRCANCAELTRPPTADPESAIAEPLSSEPASTWTRIGAYILDYLAVNVVGTGLVFAAGLAIALIMIGLAGEFVSQGEEDRMRVTAGSAAISLAVAWSVGYFWIGNARGGTPAKRLLNLHVVDANTGKPIGLARGLLRLVVWQIGYLALLIGWLWSIKDARKQAWHDKAARSVVVWRQREKSAPERPPWYRRRSIVFGGTGVIMIALVIAISIVLLRSIERAFESDFPAGRLDFSRGLAADDCVSIDDFGPLETPCDGAGVDGTVLAVLTLPDGPYPGDEELSVYAQVECPSLTTFFYIPLGFAWRQGHQDIVCISTR